MTKSSWTVLLCKFNDDSTEPFTRDYYDDLFTSSEVGSQNMVDFFRDVSHGNLDLSDTRVLGWYTLKMKRSEYAGLSGRGDLIIRARQAAAANGDILPPGDGVVVCMNVPTDLFGGGDGVVCDSLSTEPRFLGQEMGHFYGLDHSRAATITPCGNDSGIDYKDFWDVMSTAGCAFSAPHPRFSLIGPGLNAANMASRGWLDESRVWKANSGSYDTVVQLRPLHRRDLPGYLAARIGEYLVEFRSTEKWDAAIPRPAVLIHRFEDNHSYIMSANNGDQDLVVGSVFGTTDTKSSHATIFTGATGVEVVKINAKEQFARIRLVHLPAFEEPSLGGFLFGGATGGYLLVGKGIRRIPPDSPLIQILDQVAAYDSSEAIASVSVRTAVRRETLSTIASLVENQVQKLQTFRQPAPSRPTAGCEGETEYESE